MAASLTQHPADETLSNYGLGRLDGEAAEAVRRHLDGCPECRRRLVELMGDREGRPPRGPESRGVPAGDPALAHLPPGLAEHPDYEIRRELGRDEMGAVYLAYNRLMGRNEVLRVMSPPPGERPERLERALREFRAAARLRHPNIAAAYAAFRVGESVVLATEYVEGLDLSRVVELKGPLPVAHACRIAYLTALALQHAHEQGLDHRDIKPANLMLSREGRRATVKVLDFGLAGAARGAADDRMLTREGRILGTPDYLAPERTLDDAPADVRADIYSLGATVYYLLIGRPPFPSSTFYETLQSHLSRDADPLNLIRPEVPAELAALVARMMAKDPARRFQAPGEVAEALRPFVKTGGERATTDLPRPVDPDDPRSAAGPGTVPCAAAGGSTADLDPPRPPGAPRPTEGLWPRLRAAIGSLAPARRPEGRPLVEPVPRGEGGDVLALAASKRRRSLGRLGAFLRRLARPLVSRFHLGGRAADAVECTVFAPPDVGPGEPFVVQVFAHTDAQAEQAARFAVLFDRDARPRGFKSLEVEVGRGARLLFHLDLPSLIVDDPIQGLVWRGRPAAAQFRARVPADHPPGDVVGHVAIALDSVPVGYIVFKLTVPPAGRRARPTLRPLGTASHRFRKAFISYASPDRREVLKRVQMLRHANIKYFQDVLELEPGDRWEPKLYRLIDKCDLFLLFWSSAAKQSRRVMEEIRYALRRQGGEPSSPPQIRPVIIEGPPAPRPPEELAHLHFNDRLLYLMADPGRSTTEPRA